MPVEKTQVDAEIGLLEPPEDTTVEPAPDDLEDTFRTGPPGSLPPVPISDELDDAGPTAKTPVPKLEPPKVRVVEERVRAQLKLPRPNTVPPQAQAKKEPPKKAYDLFSHEDPPAVGVDPAVFPIHRSAPASYLGQRIILGLVGALMTMVVIAFVIGGESSEARAVRLAQEERFALAAEQQEQILARRQQLATRRTAAGQTLSQAARTERAVRIKAAKKAIVERRRAGARARKLARAPYQFTDGKVDQPRNYDGAPEHVPPPGTKPLMVLMSSPPAFVYRDSKLYGATPLIVPIPEETKSVTVTFRKFGYQDQTVQVRPGSSGNLEASVVLEKDPALEGRTVVTKETPKS